MSDLDSRFVAWAEEQRGAMAEALMLGLALGFCAAVVSWWEFIALWPKRMAFLVVLGAWYMGAGARQAADNLRDGNWVRVEKKEMARMVLGAVAVLGGFLVVKLVYARWLWV